MKFTIPQPDLLAAINRVHSVVPTKDTIPILAHLKLEHDAVTATDLDIQARATFAATVDEPGEILVESARFRDFIRRIPADRSIAIEDGTVKAGRSRAKLATLPVDQFPVPFNEIDSEPFTLAASDVRHILLGPLAAVSDEETRYYLCGVFLYTTDEGELRGVATDGHKLIRRAIDAPDGCTLAPGVIIPTKTLTILQKALGDDPVQIQADSSSIRFWTGAFDIRSRLISGTFPDYERVIPRERENPVTVHRAEAIGVAERVAAATSDDLRTLVFRHAPDGIEVSGESAEAQADDVILAETNGEFPHVGFAMKNFTTLLGAMEGEQVVFHFGESIGPHVITDPERPHDVHVLMPVRVG